MNTKFDNKSLYCFPEMFINFNMFEIAQHYKNIQSFSLDNNFTEFFWVLVQVSSKWDTFYFRTSQIIFIYYIEIWVYFWLLELDRNTARLTDIINIWKVLKSRGQGLEHKKSGSLGYVSSLAMIVPNVEYITIEWTFSWKL